jgi:hypothetical protein
MTIQNVIVRRKGEKVQCLQVMPSQTKAPQPYTRKLTVGFSVRFAMTVAAKSKLTIKVGMKPGQLPFRFCNKDDK